MLVAVQNRRLTYFDGAWRHGATCLVHGSRLVAKSYSMSRALTQTTDCDFNEQGVEDVQRPLDIKPRLIGELSVAD